MKTKVTVLVTGSRGQLGRELGACAPESLDWVGRDLPELDICNREQLRSQIEELAPEFILNAAAYTDVDAAETERETAFEVNRNGVCHLAEIAAVNGITLIHLSTDFVFDGVSGRPYRPDDEPNPLGAYGRSKWEGERRVLEILPDRGIIVRTSWLYSRYGINFVKTMLRLLGSRESLEVVEDQIGSPTWARGLAKLLWKMIASRAAGGIYHWSDAGVASWYDFAIAIGEEARTLGLLDRVARVRPISSERYQSPAARPSYSVLDKTETLQAFSLEPLHWRENLRHMLREDQGSATTLASP